MNEPVNVHIQRACSRLPLTALILLILLTINALPPSAEEAFIRSSSLMVERNHRACAGAAAESPSAMLINWQPMALTSKQSSELRRILVEAERRNRADEKDAEKHGQVTGGVPGCVSYDFRITFTHGDVTETTILHLCAGWLDGKTPIKSITFKHSENGQLEKLLKAPCP